MRVQIQTIPTVGEGSNCFSREVRTSFSSRKQMATYDFHGGGGGGVETWRPENSLDNVFLVINLFYSLQSGSNGFITEGRRGSNFFQGVGVSKETHITCDFPGGVRTP